MAALYLNRYRGFSLVQHKVNLFLSFTKVGHFNAGANRLVKQVTPNCIFCQSTPKFWIFCACTNPIPSNEVSRAALYT